MTKGPEPPNSAPPGALPAFSLPCGVEVVLGAVGSW